MEDEKPKPRKRRKRIRITYCPPANAEGIEPHYTAEPQKDHISVVPELTF